MIFILKSANENQLERIPTIGTPICNRILKTKEVTCDFNK
jgi:hypothetical protein